jgi:hypothetical protein
MGLFDYIFKFRPKVIGTYQGKYQLLEGYSPHFRRWGGELYESELVRAAINARATHISKLDVAIQGSARPALQRKLKAGPNSFQTWSQFLYRLSTILDVHNTAFICPVYDEFGEPSGIYTPLPNKCEIVQYNDVPYLRYEFHYGQHAAIELEYCGIMTKMQYKNDLFGETNHALFPTMELINTQNQGIEEGVKSAASYKFMARLNNFQKTEDIAKERKRFTEENLKSEDGNGGLLLFPNTYQDIRQIETKPFVIDAEQAKAIRDNVYSYFGVNEKILTNEFDDKVWSAFYEGAVEPFAVQFSEVMTKMLFTLREQAQGNSVTATSNRLQYMSNADKLNVSSQLLDRGIFSINDVRQIWNLPPVEGGDSRIIRGEYYNADDKVEGDNSNEEGDSDV